MRAENAALTNTLIDEAIASVREAQSSFALSAQRIALAAGNLASDPESLRSLLSPTPPQDQDIAATRLLIRRWLAQAAAQRAPLERKSCNRDLFKVPLDVSNAPGMAGDFLAHTAADSGESRAWLLLAALTSIPIDAGYSRYLGCSFPNAVAGLVREYTSERQKGSGDAPWVSGLRNAGIVGHAR